MRSEIIQEIIHTEELFCERLLLFTQIFIIPLRAQNSRAWIAGVPTDVAHLFDWFEDIYNLHCQLLNYMRSTCTTSGQDCFSKVIRQGTAKLELYQPYLVRLADGLEAIKEMINNPNDDFGEYVRIQQNDEKSEFNLQTLLLEPANRVAGYPAYFKVGAYRLVVYMPLLPWFRFSACSRRRQNCTLIILQQRLWHIRSSLLSECSQR